MATLDAQTIRHALEVAREHGFAEVEVGIDGASFKASLEPVKKKKTAAASQETPTEPQLAVIKATLVGYYNEAKSPLAPGVQVKKGDSVAVVTALGLANDVESSVTGEVVEVLVTPGQAVEYGQVLATVRSAP